VTELPITQSGCYDIDIEEYHSQCCDGVSTSSSQLQKVLACPVKFWAMSDLNPKRFPEKPRKVFEIGRAAHSLVLGEPEFNKHFYVLPSDAPRRPAKSQRSAKKPSDASIKAILFWDALEQKPQALLKPEDFEIVELMALGLRLSPQVSQAFKNGEPEKSLIWKDEETGIWLKARPDWLPNDPKSEFICEYKTAVTIDPWSLTNAVFRYGYHMQAALQIDGVQAVFGVKPLGVAHVVQEKEPPYLAELRMFTPEQIETGRKTYRKALRLLAQCLETGKWPGFTAEPTFFETPYRIAMQSEDTENDDRIRKPETRYTAEDYASVI
jgi:hypothetical protein